MKHTVDRMDLAAGRYRLQRGHIFLHRHHLRPRQLLEQGVAFLMIAVSVSTEQNADVGELEPELGH